MFSSPTVAASCLIQSPVANFSADLIVDYFRAPKCEQCSGNRGIELQLQRGQAIFAAADGVVSFRGEVNRIKYLVILTANNRRFTYGKISSSNVRAGERVFAGQEIAESGESLYFGIRETVDGVAQYLDPMLYLATNSKSARRAVLISDDLTSDWSGSAGIKNPLNSQC
ncbi:MAG: peptidoglycan DD-metalloendopeptidase family protein [Acidimicrobiaceae bacterium]